MDSDNERWCTPPEVFKPLMEEFRFDVDAAADRETTRLPLYLTDSLNLIVWPGKRIWLNPPYGKKLEPFVRKAAEQRSGRLIVALIPFRCRAAWWHDCVIGQAKEVRCVRKRIRFMRPDGTRGKYTMSCDSCLVVWDGINNNTQLTSWKFK